MNKNIISNFFGTIWSGLSIYLFLPFYLKYLGEEAFGLIMFSQTIQAIILLLDGGFSFAIRREIAQSKTDENYILKIKSLIKTTEFLYGIIFLVIILLSINFSGLISKYWFHFSKLNNNEVKFAIILMCCNAVVQMQSSLYNGSLLALEKQVLSNILQFFFTLLRNGFVIFILFFFKSPVFFLLWQLIVIVIFLFIQRKILFNSIRINNEVTSIKGKINYKLFKETWSVSIMFFSLTIISTINLQTDKIIISNLLPIENIGYYNTAYYIGQILISLSGPIAVAILPSIIKAYGTNNSTYINIVFHRYAKINSILVSSIATIIYWNSNFILELWTNNIQFSDNLIEIIPFMVISGIFLSSQIIPFNLAIATAELKPIIFIGIGNILLTIPSYYFFVKLYSLKGAAIVWMISNLFMMLLNCFFYIQKVMPRHYFLWLFYDIFLPFIVISTLGTFIVFLKPIFENRIHEILSIGISFFILFSLGSVIFFSNYIFKVVRVKFK